MRKFLISLLFFLSTTLFGQVLAFSPFAEGSLGVNALTDISEGARSESGLGMNLNAKGGFMLGALFGGVDFNFSVINSDDGYFNKVEENNYGVVGGVNLAGFSRLYLSLYPVARAQHDNGEYKGFAYKFGAAVFLPFMPMSNLLVEFRNASYDKAKRGASYVPVSDLEVSTLTLSFAVFFN